MKNKKIIYLLATIVVIALAVMKVMHIPYSGLGLYLMFGVSNFLLIIQNVNLKTKIQELEEKVK